MVGFYLQDLLTHNDQITPILFLLHVIDSVWCVSLLRYPQALQQPGFNQHKKADSRSQQYCKSLSGENPSLGAILQRKNVLCMKKILENILRRASDSLQGRKRHFIWRLHVAKFNRNASCQRGLLNPGVIKAEGWYSDYLWL